MTSRIRTAAIAIATASLATASLGTQAHATDVMRLLARVSLYADRVEAIFADGFESGDIAAVRRATNNLTAQIDGLTAGGEAANHAACLDDVAASVHDIHMNQGNALANGEVTPQQFLLEISGLRSTAEACRQFLSGGVSG